MKLLFLLILAGCGASNDTGFYTPGASGPQGPQGPAGQNGSACFAVQLSGGAEIVCSNGSVASIANGIQGPQGNIGAPGLAGATITVVQFCPGYTSTYPSVFPEVGFCIDGTLYAEYYDPPTSGLTELPPGAYSSTQTSAPCNFTVGQDCTLSY